jgi:hypothetical protein
MKLDPAKKIKKANEIASHLWNKYMHKRTAKDPHDLTEIEYVPNYFSCRRCGDCNPAKSHISLILDSYDIKHNNDYTDLGGS